MRYLFLLILFSQFGLSLRGQTQSALEEGTVSYITSQNVYIKFKSTKNISEGDTLYIRQESKLLPALKVNKLSSISCVCSPLSSYKFKLSDLVFVKLKPTLVSPDEKTEDVIVTNILPAEKVSDSLELDTDKEKPLKQEVSGRISVSSYSNFYNNDSPNSQRMRYTFSFRGNNLGNSKFSIDSYISFVHSNTNWEEVKENIFNGLKIYSFAAKYDFNETTTLLLGRKINPKLSSVGAIDGLQFEKKIKSFTIGAFAGSRPDYSDYSINFDLLQYGIYLGHEHRKGNQNIQSTLGFIEQTNNSVTDRRFIYLQHSNTLVRNLHFFSSAELDLYKVVDEQKENTFSLTNLYLSLRYRIIKKLSLSVSYSNRQNVIYYETYKDFIDRLLETEALQGWRAQINYRPIKHLSIGLNAGYRFRKEDPAPTKNLHSYIRYSRIPVINTSVTISATILETSYLSGNIYSIGLSKDLIPGKINSGLKYRYIDYNFINSAPSMVQNVGEINLTWRIYKKLSMSVYYEGSFEKEINYNRIYLNITQRF